MRKRRKGSPQLFPMGEGAMGRGSGCTRRYFSLVSLVWILSISFFCWFSRFSRALRSSMKVASPCLMFLWRHKRFSGDGVSSRIFPGSKSQ